MNKSIISLSLFLSVSTASAWQSSLNLTLLMHCFIPKPVCEKIAAVQESIDLHPSFLKYMNSVYKLMPRNSAEMFIKRGFCVVALHKSIHIIADVVASPITTARQASDFLEKFATNDALRYKES